MKDYQWRNLIRKAQCARLEHEQFTQEAEKEYERRYGVNPRDVDNDWWIDTLDFGVSVDMAMLQQQAALCSPSNKPRQD